MESTYPEADDLALKAVHDYDHLTGLRRRIREVLTYTQYTTSSAVATLRSASLNLSLSHSRSFEMTPLSTPDCRSQVSKTVLVLHCNYVCISYQVTRGHSK